MGIAPDEPNEEPHSRTIASIASANPETVPGNMNVHDNKDAIWSVSRQEAIRLIAVYEDEMHAMYPVVSLTSIRTHTNFLYKFMDAAARSGLIWGPGIGPDAISDDDTNALKLVLAIALHVEGMGTSELGERLFRDVQPSVDGLLLGNAGVKHVRNLALTV